MSITFRPASLCPSRRAAASRPGDQRSLSAFMTAAVWRRGRSSMLAAANHDGSSQHLAEQPPTADSHRVTMPGPAKNKDDVPRRTLTVRLPVALIERLRHVARDAAGYPAYATMSGMVEAGVISECDRIEKVLRAAYQGGRTDPPAARRTGLGNRRVGVINTHCSGDDA